MKIMDGKTKNMVMTGMTALCLILGIMGVMGDSWLVSEGDDESPDANYSLTAVHQDAESTEMCAFMSGLAGGECDGSMWSMTFSDLCDASDDEEMCDMATGGTIGTIGMWAGVVCALIMTLSLALPMAGVDAMDAVPEMVNKIAMWGAGGLMLVGMLGWYVMLGDGDSEMGIHVWMAGAAMSLGLGAAAISQFIEADE